MPIQYLALEMRAACKIPAPRKFLVAAETPDKHTYSGTQLRLVATPFKKKHAKKQRDAVLTRLLLFFWTRSPKQNCTLRNDTKPLHNTQ